MEDYDHALSVRKAFRQERTCHHTTCIRKVRLVVNSFPLCIKHATEEFTQMLREYGVRS